MTNSIRIDREACPGLVSRRQGGTQVGHLSDVLFEDMHAESENGIVIGGTAESPVHNISFKVAVPLPSIPAYVVLFRMQACYTRLINRTAAVSMYAVSSNTCSASARLATSARATASVCST